MTAPGSEISMSGRATVPVRRGLEQRLLAYAAAASASFVATQPAAARVVYTPLDLTIRIGSVPLDLNHDGVVDFSIVGAKSHTLSASFTHSLRVNAFGNAGAGVLASRYDGASALALGAVIGPGGHFLKVQNANARMAWVEQTDLDTSVVSCRGAFANGPSFTYFCQGTKDRFLGLRFVVNGQTHYGWAGFSVVTIKTGPPAHIFARLVGIAYEDIPDRPIRAGQLQDSATAMQTARPTPSPRPSPCWPWARRDSTFGADGSATKFPERICRTAAAVHPAATGPKLQRRSGL